MASVWSCFFTRWARGCRSTSRKVGLEPAVKDQAAGSGPTAFPAIAQTPASRFQRKADSAGIVIRFGAGGSSTDAPNDPYGVG